MKAIKISRKLLKEEGVVYVLEIELNGVNLIKIGMTTRLVEERVCEILTSIWKKYRVFPRCVVHRFTKVPNPLDIEVKLHGIFKGDRYKVEKSFSGSTEIFLLDVQVVKDKYDELVKNENPV